MCRGCAPEFTQHLHPTGGPNKSQQRPTLLAPEFTQHLHPTNGPNKNQSRRLEASATMRGMGTRARCPRVGPVALIQRRRVRRSRDRPCPALRHACLKTDLFRGLLHATSRYDRRDFALHSRTGPSCAAAVRPNSSNTCIPPTARTNLNSDRPYTRLRARIYPTFASHRRPEQISTATDPTRGCAPEFIQHLHPTNGPNKNQNRRLEASATMASFIAQGDHGIHVHGAARRQPACQRRHRRK